MKTRSSLFTHAQLASIAVLASGCLPPLNEIDITNAYIQAVGDPVPDDSSTSEPSSLSLEDTVVTYAMLTADMPLSFSDSSDEICKMFMQVDEGYTYELPLLNDLGWTDGVGYEASFLTTFAPSYFSLGNHIAKFSVLHAAKDGGYQYASSTYTLDFIVSEPITNLAPTISSVTATPNPAGNDSSVTFTANVTDDYGLDAVTLSLDDISYTMAESTTDTYTVTVDAGDFTLPAASVDFGYFVSATDSYGLSTNSSSSTLTIEDVVAPTISAVSATPDSADNLPTTIVIFDATITDKGTGVDASTVCMTITDTGICYPLTALGSDVYTVSFTGDMLSTPTTSYTLYSSDLAGLAATPYSGELTVTNISGLTINNLTVTPSTVSNASATLVDIILDAEDLQDASALLSAYCTLDGAALTDLFYDGTGTTFSGSFDSNAYLVAGDYEISCTVQDSDGYTAVASQTFTVIDQTAPTLDCSATDGANDGSTDVSLYATVSEESTMGTVTYTSSLASGSLTNTSADSWETAVSVTGIPAGDYTFTLYATDSAGNVSDSCTTPASVSDAVAPYFGSCSLSSSTISNNGGSVDIICTGVGDETTLDSVVAIVSGIGTYDMSCSSGTCTGTIILPSSSPYVAADSYSVIVEASDGIHATDYSTLTLTVTDDVAPIGSCSVTASGNNQDSSLSCTFEDETDATSDITAMYTITDLVSTSTALSYATGSFDATIPTTSAVAQTYTGEVVATDSSGNSSSPFSVSFTLTDALAPSASCSLSSSSISNASGSSILTVSASDETTISSATYSSSLVSGSLTGSSGSYSASINASGIVAGTYIITGTVSDGTNTTSCTASLDVTDGTAPIFDALYADPSSVSDDGPETFVVYACVTDETDGTELAGSGGVSATIDSLVETLSYDSGTSCYVSRTINGDEFSQGAYTITATATDAAGNTATDSSASVDVTESHPCAYTCTSNLCLYVDGTLNAELSTSYPSAMSSIDTIRVGYSGQHFDNLSLVVGATPYVSENFDTDVGCFSVGSVSGGQYVSASTDNDCSFSAFDASGTTEWAVSIDVIAGSSPNFALRSTTIGSYVGANWDYASGGYLNDGAGTSDSFSGGTPDTTSTHTITLCNANSP